MLRRRNALLLIMFVLLASVSRAQIQGSGINEEFSIDLIGVRDGLLSNFVTKTVSDNDNLKYFATEGGISKFDGYSFQNFRPGPEYPGLENENIETLFKDRENNIWIGTKSGGVSRLDIATNSITCYNHLFKPVTSRKLRTLTINEDKQGRIWIGTWANGVFVFDPRRAELIRHYPSDHPVYNIICDSRGIMWFISNNHLYQCKPNQVKPAMFSTDYIINNMVEDRARQKIWLIGSKGKRARLTGVDLLTSKMTDEHLDFEAIYLKSIAVDSKNRLWLGSWGSGLFVSNKDLSSFRHINTSPQGRNLDQVNYSMILSIDIDKNGIAWIGTAYGGVLILYPNKGFKLIPANKKDGRMDQNVISLYKDKQGEMLTGTLMEGLFSSRQNAYEKISSVQNSRINTIYEKGNFLFIGANNGLYIVKDKDFAHAFRTFKNEKVTAVLLDSKNRLWIGTQQKGLKMTDFGSDPYLQNCKNYSEEDLKHPLENNRINHIKEDKAGNIWLATYSGLNLYDQKRDNFVSHADLLGQKLPNIIINDLYVDGRELVLGTPTGLAVLVNTAKGILLKNFYTNRNGLINDFICAIRKDNAGDYWLSTTTSIVRFKPSNQTFINYEREDGVMINSFHIASSFKDAEGLIYFGGSNGYIVFDPAHVSTKFRIPDIVFTQLSVNNKVLAAGDEIDGNVILEKAIQFTNKVSLGYSQNYLSIAFAANDFNGPNNITYLYKLKGLNDNWISLGGRNEINFTELRSGNYELLIKASRNNLDWSPERKLLIHIATPPWFAWYAFLLYGLLVIGLLVLVRYISLRQNRLKTELRIAQIEKNKEHDLSEAKITFFTNISHEFRTPLTLILSPVTELLGDRSISEMVRNKLQLVQSNSRRMLSLINQLLDFRKSEHGLLRLRSDNYNFVEFSHEVFESFEESASHKNIRYRFRSDIKEQHLYFDRNQMEIVLCNLLSNAFKYTSPGGEITVKISDFGEELCLEVADNGVGLSGEDQEKIFDRFFQVQNSETAAIIGSGIGLAFSKNIVELHGGSISVESTLGKGSVFRVLLPKKLPGTLIAETQGPGNSQLAEEADWSISKQADNSASSKEFTVLIADDNEDIRAYLKSLLSDSFKLLEAPDGQEALSLVRSEMPDLVISDVMMPKMDGIKLCNEIKSHIHTSHIPVILLTARASERYEIAGLKTGVEDYIVKPFNPGIVKSRIQNVLENRKKLREYMLNKVRFEPDSTEVTDSSLDSEFIDKAIQLVNENLQNSSFGIESMVDQLCMSQSTLYRKIKSLTGLSITGFIRSVKLKKAAQLIINGNDSLASVAYEAGFNDYKYFKKSFQHQFGCLPSEYKEKILKESAERV